MWEQILIEGNQRIWESKESLANIKLHLPVLHSTLSVVLEQVWGRFVYWKSVTKCSWSQFCSSEQNTSYYYFTKRSSNIWGYMLPLVLCSLGSGLCPSNLSANGVISRSLIASRPVDQCFEHVVPNTLVQVLCGARSVIQMTQFSSHSHFSYWAQG